MIRKYIEMFWLIYSVRRFVNSPLLYVSNQLMSCFNIAENKDVLIRLVCLSAGISQKVTLKYKYKIKIYHKLRKN